MMSRNVHGGLQHEYAKRDARDPADKAYRSKDTKEEEHNTA